MLFTMTQMFEIWLENSKSLMHPGILQEICFNGKLCMLRNVVITIAEQRGAANFSSFMIPGT